MATPYQVYLSARMPVLKTEAEACGAPLSSKELRARVSSEWKEARKAEKEARKVNTEVEVHNTRIDLYISYLRSLKEHNHVLYEKKKGFNTRHSNLSEHFTENTLKWYLRKEDKDVVCCRLTSKKGGRSALSDQGDDTVQDVHIRRPYLVRSERKMERPLLFGYDGPVHGQPRPNMASSPRQQLRDVAQHPDQQEEA